MLSAEMAQATGQQYPAHHRYLIYMMDNTNMAVLRKLEKNDFEAWLKLWKLYLEFYRHPFDAEVTQFSFDRFIYANGDMHCAVVEEAGQAVGFVHYIFHPSTWSKGYYCYLQDLYVLQDQRSQGLARQLIEYVYECAQARNCSRVYWLTHESNGRAMALYDKVADNAGFIQYRKNFSQ